MQEMSLITMSWFYSEEDKVKLDIKYNYFVMNKFIKCDFHIHGPSSFDTSITSDEIIEGIISSQIDIVSITDHNVIDFEVYEKLKSKCIKYFYGVEINTSLSEDVINKWSLSTSKGKYFHTIFIFKDNEVAQRASNEINLLFGDEHEGKSALEISTLRQGKYIDLEALLDNFSNSNIDYFMIPHEGKSSRNITDFLKNKDENDKPLKGNVLYKRYLFQSNRNFIILDGKWKKNKTIIDFFENAHLNSIPSFSMSDEHWDNKDNLRIGKHFTWICFDGTFEGLNEVVTDPEFRVYPTENNDLSPVGERKYLERIEFELKGKEISVELSPQYNSVIGRRGSGKSLLLSLINGLSNHGDKYNGLNVNNVRYKFSDSDTFTTNEINSGLVSYISQGEIEGMFKPGTNIEDNDLFKSIKANLIQGILSNKNKYNESLVNIESELLRIVSLIEDLQKMSEISFKSKRVSDLSLSSILNINEPFTGNISKIKLDRSFSADIKNRLEKSRLDVNNDEHFRKHDILELSNNIGDEIKNFDGREDKSKFESLNKKLKMFELLKNSIIKNINTDGESYQSLIGRLILSLRVHKELNGLFEKITNIFKNAEDEFVVKSELQTNSYDYIFTLKPKFDLDIKSRITEKLKSNHDEIDFIRELIFNPNGKDIINSNKNKSLDYINLLKKVINEISQIFNTDVDSLREYFDIEVLYKEENTEKDLFEQSPGTRATHIWNIFLNRAISDEKILVLLDQPEDHLDGIQIRETIVNWIRNNKYNKQIVCASHNASVVINGDSNNIIKSEYNNEEFEYRNSSMYKFTEDISGILDGGIDYLVKRFDKYNLNKLGVKNEK